MNFGDFSWYAGNLPWLQHGTIFLTEHGSRAYGTNTPESDHDLKGVAIPPREYFLGYLNKFEQSETRDPVDCVVYDIRKFFNLAADCNPNIIEVLFTDPASHIKTTEYWEHILEHRDLFLSRKALHTFSGYAFSQLKRIRTHRQWLLNPAEVQPQRSDFGLSDHHGTLGQEQLGVVNAFIRKAEDKLAGEGVTKDVLEENDASLVQQSVEQLELSPNLIPIIIAERKYASAHRNWEQYQTWKSQRNPKRAALEAKYGYDCKHASHLCRLLRMASEILSGRSVIVKRPDAQELLDIRNGAWTYDQIIEYATRTEAELKVTEASSPLPKSPDRKRIDQILVGTVEWFLFQ